MEKWKEKRFKDLLECPVCFHTIDSVPIYQCVNGHVLCKDCHPKLENCPICRDDGPISLRNLKLEEIVKRYVLFYVKIVKLKNCSFIKFKANQNKFEGLN